MTNAAESLPFDICREIFVHFSSPMTLFVRKRRPSGPQFPWYLLHICSSWRAVLLSMHREFWSSFILHPVSDTDPPLEQERIKVLTQMFLNHTEGRPFSFRLHRISSEFSVDILKTFIACSSRWEDAYIKLGRSSQYQILSAIKNLDSLRSFTLDLDWVPNPLTDVPNDIFINAPHLNHVGLPSLLSWRLPWTSITSLYLTTAYEMETLRNIVPFMDNLQELCIPRHGAHPIQVDSQPLDIPSLKSLKVWPITILKCLNTPRLENLVINLGENDDPHYNPAFSDPCFFDSFFERLRHLKYLALIPRSSYILSLLLPYVPQLQTLTLDFCSDPHFLYDNWFHPLLCSPGKQPLVPRLETWEIIYDRRWPKIASAAADVIASRTVDRPPNVHPLRRFKVFLGPEMGNQLESGLQLVRKQCKASGVDFTVEPLYDDPRAHYFHTYERWKHV